MTFPLAPKQLVSAAVLPVKPDANDATAGNVLRAETVAGVSNLGYVDPDDWIAAATQPIADEISKRITGGRGLELNVEDKLSRVDDPQYHDCVEDFLHMRWTGSLLYGDSTWHTGTNTGNENFTYFNLTGGNLEVMSGAVTVRTGSVSSEDVFLGKGFGETSKICNRDEIDEFSWVVLPGVATDVTMCLGFGDDMSTDRLGANSLRFEFDPANHANWRFIVRTSGSDDTPVDTGVAGVALQLTRLGIRMQGSNWEVHANGSLISTVAVPSAKGGQPGLYLRTNTNASRVLTVDRVAFHTTQFSNREVF